MNIFFLEKVRAKYIFYFKLLRDSPIDQIVQTVFGYSLRKEQRQQNYGHEHYLKTKYSEVEVLITLPPGICHREPGSALIQHLRQSFICCTWHLHLSCKHFTEQSNGLFTVKFLKLCPINARFVKLNPVSVVRPFVFRISPDSLHPLSLYRAECTRIGIE